MEIPRNQLFLSAKQVFRDWVPTSYQRQIFESVFIDKKTYVFAEWSRGGGKTLTALYLAFLATQLYPGRSVLYIAPTKDAGKGIIQDKSLNFPTALMADKSRPSEGLFRFKNGSSLQILGSEGDVTRGREPVLVIYDEFREHNPRAHNAIAPILRKGGRLVIISTPPRQDEIENGRAKFYEDMVDLCKNEPFAAYFAVTVDELLKESVVTQDFIDLMKADYTRRGEYEEFLAEFYLKRVYKSRDSYFHDIEESLLVPSSNMIKLIENVSDPTFIIFGDSSGSSRWGSIFACLDEEDGVLYLMDSVVCHREGRNTTENREASDLVPSRYWPLLQHKMQKWLPGSDENNWYIGWDRDTTFVDVIPLMFGSHIDIAIVEKKYDKKRETFSLIRDLIKLNKMYIGEDCRTLITEMKLLSIDPKTGDFVKKNDELLDCLRYLIMTFDTCFENKTPMVDQSPVNYFEHMAQEHFARITQQEKEDDLGSLLSPEEFW